MTAWQDIHCSKREELQATASAALQHMSDLLSEQLKALQEDNKVRLLALDQSLEEAFGEKERAFGALDEHTKEHGC